MFGSTTPEAGIRTLDDLGDEVARTRVMQGLARVVRGRYLSMEGRTDEALRLLHEASEISGALGLRFIAAAHEEELGDVELRAGHLEAAASAFRRNYDVLDELGDEGHKSTSAANLARVLCQLGRFEEAEGLAATAREIAAADDVASQSIGRSAHALVLSARGEHAEAEDLAREGVQIYLDARAQSPQFHGNAWMDLSTVLRAAGKLTEAAEAAREALALYELKGDRVSAASTRAFLEELGAPA
jgi:tetratricopeptide (TPR) repeat protein